MFNYTSVNKTIRHVTVTWINLNKMCKTFTSVRLVSTFPNLHEFSKHNDFVVGYTKKVSNSVGVNVSKSMVFLLAATNTFCIGF